MTQDALFTTTPTAAEIEGWINDVNAGSYNATFFIYPTARGQIEALLREPVTPGPWKPKPILGLFGRALAAARQVEAQQ